MAYYEKISDIEGMISDYYSSKKPSVGLGVVIKNSSNFDLEYVNSGVVTGFNVEPVVNMFKKAKKIVIEPEHAGGLMWDRHGGGEFGG